MFTVIYIFSIKPQQQETFIENWSELTRLIYKYEGSLGSRLHQLDKHRFIAYAQWPNRETWANSGGNLPKSADLYKKKMKDCCTEIIIQYELTVLKDLLKTKQASS